MRIESPSPKTREWNSSTRHEQKMGERYAFGDITRFIGQAVITLLRKLHIVQKPVEKPVIAKTK